MEAYEQLEHEWAEFCDREHTVACASGTAALHLALETLRVTESWDEKTIGSSQPVVAVPDFSMIACARSVTTANMIPHFVDVGEDGLIQHQDDTPYPGNTTCIMYVHTYGRRCSISDKHSLGYLGSVEDLAEAHGVNPRKESLAGCWSFYKNKVIAGEEGGMVAFQNEEQAKYAKSLRSLGFTDAHNFWHNPRGMNYRLSNSHARIVSLSLKNYSRNLTRRRRVQSEYNSVCPQEWQLPKREIPWVYDLDLPEGVDVDKVVHLMRLQGIAARCSFKPLSKQPEYRESNQNTSNPVAERLSKRRMYLPIYPDLRSEQIIKSIKCLEEIVKQEISGSRAPA